MAQKPSAERFLAPLAKRASAGVTLALALAAFALALAGCGGGGEDSAAKSSSTAASADTGAAGEPSDKGAAGAGQEQAKEGGAGEKAAPGGSADTAGSNSQNKGGTGQKQGPRIAAPKGPREQAPSSEEIAEATVADISLQSPAIPAATPEAPGALPATYTCDGKDSWPELRWAGVPAGSAELILYAMSVQPVEGKLFVDWAVAGLDPTLTSVEAGKLPQGAVVGTNSFGERGYEICPPAGSGEIYMFALYALPRSLSPQKGFDARELRKEILDVSGNVGLLPTVYARG